MWQTFEFINSLHQIESEQICRATYKKEFSRRPIFAKNFTATTTIRKLYLAG
jgi:hypothetical protein